MKATKLAFEFLSFLHVLWSVAEGRSVLMFGDSIDRYISEAYCQHNANRWRNIHSPIPTESNRNVSEMEIQEWGK